MNIFIFFFVLSSHLAFFSKRLRIFKSSMYSNCSTVLVTIRGLYFVEFFCSLRRTVKTFKQTNNRFWQYLFFFFFFGANQSTTRFVFLMWQYTVAFALNGILTRHRILRHKHWGLSKARKMTYVLRTYYCYRFSINVRTNRQVFLCLKFVHAIIFPSCPIYNCFDFY